MAQVFSTAIVADVYYVSREVTPPANV